jgi:N utilization substance protein B
MGSRRKARECALQMLFAADFAEAVPEEVLKTYWVELGDSDVEESAREFATRLAAGTLSRLETLDERIRSRAEHWRIPRMAIVDRNILRLAVYEFLYEPTPRTVAINEALEIARRFSTYEATQFINGILDAIKRDLDEQQPQVNVQHEEVEPNYDDEPDESTGDEHSEASS